MSLAGRAKGTSLLKALSTGMLLGLWMFAVLEGAVGGGVVIIRYGDGVFCFTAIDVR